MAERLPPWLRYGGQEKAVPACLISNSLEFEGIKTRVVYLFPDAEEEDGVLVLEPLLNERTATLEIPYHVGERDEVAMFPGQDGDGCALDFDGGFLWFAHGVIAVAGVKPPQALYPLQTRKTT